MKNDDPHGCPDQVMGNCELACVYCRSGDRADKLEALAAAARTFKRTGEVDPILNALDTLDGNH